MGLFTKMRMKEAVRGTAQVVSATAHRGDSSWQDIRMTLTVRAEGVSPTAIEHSCMCRADRWPSPGDVLPVTVDARKPKRLKVEWDEVESARDRAWSTATAMAAAEQEGGLSGQRQPAGVDIEALKRAFPGATIDVQSYSVDATAQPDMARQVLAALQQAGAGPAEARRPAESEDEAAERIANLERLAKLHESGALTAEEFEAEKARILRGD